MKRLRLNLSLTSVIVLIAVGVLVPVMLATGVGIVALVLARDAGGIVTGVLVICFAAAAAGSALIATVLTARKARLARLQADFLATVTHELRTPLSAIRLYAQTLQSGVLNGDSAQAAACVATILRETEWLDVLLDKVLTWRASARDMLPLTMGTGAVTPAVDRAVTRFRSMVEAGDMVLTVSLESRLPVRHDPKAVEAVVLNLLTNAYKYTGAGKRIDVRTSDEPAGAVIEVRDNGVGLAPADTARIFRPFYRVTQQDGEAPGGIGLGLTIARHVVLKHGGTIRVDSRPGEGAAFTIRLPAAAAEGAA